MEIQNSDDGKRGAFFIDADGKRAAEMTYVHAGEKIIIIDHTEVDDSLRGKHIGDELLKAAVTLARDKGLVIRATCPFALARLRRSTEFSDVFQD